MLLMLASLYVVHFCRSRCHPASNPSHHVSSRFHHRRISVLGAAAMLINAIYSDRVQRRAPATNYPRYMHIIPWALLISAGFFACGLSTNPINVIVAIGAIIIAYSAMQGPLWSFPAASFKDDPRRRHRRDQHDRRHRRLSRPLLHRLRQRPHRRLSARPHS